MAKFEDTRWAFHFPHLGSEPEWSATKAVKEFGSKARVLSIIKRQDPNVTASPVNDAAVEYLVKDLGMCRYPNLIGVVCDENGEPTSLGL